MSTYWRFYYHLVWATRAREPVIENGVEKAISRSFELTVADLDVVAHAFGVMPDHVHVVLSIPPRIAVADVAKRLKGASSHAANESAMCRGAKFAWQPGYGALTFGEGSLQRVVAYVENQREHHADDTLWAALEKAEDDSFQRPG